MILSALKGTGSLRRRMLAIAVPIAISGLVTQAQMLIDTAFLGHYETHTADGTVLGGAEFLSAIGNVFFPYIVTLAFIWSITTGTIVLVSQRLGAGKPEDARRYAESSMKYNGLLSVIMYLVWFFAGPFVFQLMGVREPTLGLSVEYLRWMSLELLYLGVGVTSGAVFQGIGITRPEMYTGILRSALNIVLDWVLIYGRFGFPEMGAAGAGLATSLSGLIATAVMLAIVFRSKKTPFRLSLGGILKARFKPYREVVEVGLPTGIEDSLWNFGNLVLATFLNSLDAAAVGIYRLVVQIELTPVFFYFGIARAVTTIVGYRTGERRIDEAKRTGLVASFDTFVFCLLFSASFILFPRQILGIFTSNTGVVAAAAPYLTVAAFTMLPKAINIISGNGIRGYGDTLWMLVTQVFGIAFLVSVSWFLIFRLGLGMIGLFIALFLDETIRGIINTVRFYRGEYSVFHKAPADAPQAA
jgi:putative MATE family efflux protein